MQYQGVLTSIERIPWRCTVIHRSSGSFDSALAPSGRSACAQDVRVGMYRFSLAAGCPSLPAFLRRLGYDDAEDITLFALEREDLQETLLRKLCSIFAFV